MDDLERAIALVREDARSSGFQQWTAIDLDRLSHLLFNFEEGSLDHRWPQLLRYVADEVQDSVVHDQWDNRQPTNWPVCPQHPTTHPLTPVARDDHAVWVCPMSDEVIAPIGRL